MRETFPKANRQIDREGVFVLPRKIGVRADAAFDEVVSHAAYVAELLCGVTLVPVEEGGQIVLRREPMREEAYRLVVEEGGITLFAATEKGAQYAVSTLLQLMEEVDGSLEIPCGVIEDQPYLPVRGIHVYMPAREDIPEFLRIVDCLSFLKMNTLILEVGGGMEYKRHPEINESWVKFCDTLDHKLPFYGKYRYSRSLQKSDIYWKDSCHTELAGGSYLTQDEVRTVLAHCRKRGIEVIPELQSFSHAYYLTLSHREIAERQDDAFPDTYCPLNEKSYELYFDVAEEMIEVFSPKTVSVGHDELRVLGFCDRCRKKSGHELVAYELNRLHAFYASHGIRIAMWGDTAQYFINYLGGEDGGIEVNSVRYGHPYHLPATYECLKDLPSDILMLDWFHSKGATSEDRYEQYGHDVIYGNFHGSLMGEWSSRSAKGSVKGAEVSTWCPANESVFARDGIFFELAYSAYILWSEGCDNDSFDGICRGILQTMPSLRALVRGEARLGSRKESASVWYRGEEREDSVRLSLANARVEDRDVAELLGAFGNEVQGVPLHTGWIKVYPDAYARRLLFLHRANQEMPFEPSYAYREESDWTLGAYAVIYEDGDHELIPLYYGRQMGCAQFRLCRSRGQEVARGAELDDALKRGALAEKQLPCYFEIPTQWLESLCYQTTPIFDGEEAVFAYEWTNPHPEKKIHMIQPMHLNHTPEQFVTLFGIAALR